MSLQAVAELVMKTQLKYIYIMLNTANNLETQNFIKLLISTFVVGVATVLKCLKLNMLIVLDLLLHRPKKEKEREKMLIKKEMRKGK